jgi:hypothetical protein
VHRFTNKYVKEFQLESKLFEQPDAQKLWYLYGKRFVTPKPGEPWPIEQMSAEERRDPFAASERYLGPAREKIGDVNSRAGRAGLPARRNWTSSRSRNISAPMAPARGGCGSSPPWKVTSSPPTWRSRWRLRRPMVRLPRPLACEEETTSFRRRSRPRWVIASGTGRALPGWPTVRPG